MLCINTFGRVMYFPDQAKKNSKWPHINLNIAQFGPALEANNSFVNLQRYQFLRCIYNGDTGKIVNKQRTVIVYLL